MKRDSPLIELELDADPNLVTELNKLQIEYLDTMSLATLEELHSHPLHVHVIRRIEYYFLMENASYKGKPDEQVEQDMKVRIFTINFTSEDNNGY